MKIGAKDYILEAVDELPDAGTFFKTPAARHLFDVDEECEKLDKETRQVFHSIFAKLLWVGKKAKPDILVALSFLEEKDDESCSGRLEKVAQAACYLKGTANLM